MRPLYTKDKIILYPSKKRLKFVVKTFVGSYYIAVLPIKKKKGVLIVSGLDKVIEYRIYGKLKKLRKLANTLSQKGM